MVQRMSHRPSSQVSPRLHSRWCVASESDSSLARNIPYWQTEADGRLLILMSAQVHREGSTVIPPLNLILRTRVSSDRGQVVLGRPACCMGSLSPPSTWGFQRCATPSSDVILFCTGTTSSMARPSVIAAAFVLLALLVPDVTEASRDLLQVRLRPLIHACSYAAPHAQRCRSQPTPLPALEGN